MADYRIINDTCVMSHPDLPILYADESSNSGENLIDPDQPAFAVAAVRIDQHEAESLVGFVKARLPQQLREAKYGVLARSAAGRRTLLAVLEQLKAETAYSMAVNKRYMIVAMMVDNLTVELAHEQGYDMYADGSARALANLMYFAGPVEGNAAAFEKMLQTFVQAVRMKRTASVAELFDAIAAYRVTTSEQFGGYFEVFEAARQHADELVALIASGALRDTLDPAVTCLYTLCHAVGDAIGRFHLVHDQSKTIEQNVPLLQRLEQLPPASPTLPARPLPVASITFSDSASSAPLQVADWVAGATRQVAHATAIDKPDPFAEQLRPLVLPWVVETIFPSLDLILPPRRFSPDTRRRI